MRERDILRRLPSINDLSNTPEAARLMEYYGREAFISAARSVVDRLRDSILGNASRIQDGGMPAEVICRDIEAYLLQKFAPSIRSAVNAAGIILHTGLGRALLPPDAARAVGDAVSGYCTLAVDMETGQRGHRDAHLSGLLCELTGAEAATVVNNNAAATMLVLNTLAAGREVIVSRGQLVEIGGSFRMPDVMKASGAVMREVGTTNKTHLKDYVDAINENTGAILRVHQSNYRIVGFTSEPSIEELAGIAREHNLMLIDDIGSGALVDLGDFGLEREPMVAHSVAAGADAVCFSGDKLIGGPQAGIIVGKAASIERIRKNPLSRALRVGKMTVAAMEATLKLFLNRETLCEKHPTYRMFSLTLEDIEARARAVGDAVSSRLAGCAEVCITDGGSLVGSGSVPTQSIPTKLLQVRARDIPPEALARKLRACNPPIFATIHRDAVLFDFRTIQPHEDEIVRAALEGILAEGGSA